MQSPPSPLRMLEKECGQALLMLEKECGPVRRMRAVRQS
jgi:hypothetical protein